MHRPYTFYVTIRFDLLATLPSDHRKYDFTQELKCIKVNNFAIDGMHQVAKIRLLGKSMQLRFNKICPFVHGGRRD